MSSGWRWYGIGARYSTSCRAMSVIVLAPGRRVEDRGRRADGVLGVSVAHPERLDARLLEQAQHLGVVDVPVGVEVAPAQRGRDVQAHRQSLRELAVRGAVRLRGIGAEALDLVRLVRLEVALEPVPVRRVLLGALVGEDVRRDAVEEPPVVGDDHGAAGELEQRVLEARRASRRRGRWWARRAAAGCRPA